MNVPQITAKVRPLHERLWTLHRKCADGTITPTELLELDVMCAAAEQDNYPGETA